MNAWITSLVVSGILVTPAIARGLTADQVLVVANERSPISGRIAAYYQQARGIATNQLVRISTDPQEEIDRRTFQREIVDPIAAHLLRHRLPDQILAIVLTKGVPLKIRGSSGPTGSQASVDSELTLLYRALVQGSVAPEGRIPNPYFDPHPREPFARAIYDTYLVTRLDGYTWDDIRGLIDRATSPVRHGTVILATRGASRGNTWWPGDAWLGEAAEQLKDSGLPVVLAQSPNIAAGETALLGYAGWGSNDPAIRARSPGFRWVPGALASWFVSTSARTFTAPPPGWSPGSGYAGSAQSLVADLIAEGVTGTVGFVYEPYLDATARPQILFPAYRAGFTLAESFYMALPYLSWQAVVVGDPLLAPFGFPAASRPVPLPGALLFLRRRAVALEDLVARAPSPDAQRALALAYAEQARELQHAELLDEALTLARRAVAVKTDEPLALYVLGAVHAARREPDQAAAAFRTLLRHDSSSPYAREAERWLAR